MEDGRWAGVLEAASARAVPATLRDAGLDPEAHEAAVLGCGDERIAGLNAAFRGKPTPTDVLSWPASDLAPGDVPEAEMGDVAISYDTCARQAAERGLTLADHVTHLMVHATLHLLGHDHMEEAERAGMEAAEIRVLAGLGIPDPYG
nr:rRNA maturation RNase YbeY [Jannaschia sp. Os4]